jgi:transcriptional regulator with XRE-family HTH domain
MTHPLRKFRKDHKIALTDLARCLKVSRSFLHRIEAGERNPGPEATRRISAVTGISEQEIRPDFFAKMDGP